YFTDGVKSRVGGIIATISDSNWHHFNVILDRDTYATSYLDGVQTKLTFDITGQQGDIQNSRSTLIGAYSSSMDLFKGIIDDVRIYNAVLSSSQIKQNYIAGLNSLLSNGNISKEECNQRINSLSEK
ncbi:MAG: hypothetical protein PHY30_01965, partial [Candidatus Pacebacteria bacterium]|nr:hypothetical protein [Candidatus Paceibacterota bacterium]